MRLATSEAMLFKFGSGTGTDLSTLRSHPREAVGRRPALGPAVVHAGLRPDRGGGQVGRQDAPRGQDAVAQGLASRHPGVHRVQVEGRAEGPHADRKGKYEANFNGEAYSSILFQNANLSVRVTDEFMETVERAASGRRAGSPTTQRRGPGVRGPQVAEADGRVRLALRRSRRAVRHDDQPLAHLPQLGPDQRQQSVQRVHVPGRHGLQPGQHQPDEVPPPDGTFDVERFKAACRVFFIAQEILVDHASYPTDRIAENSHLFRPLGLGYSNLGSLIMSSGLPTTRTRRTACAARSPPCCTERPTWPAPRMAAAVGPFEGYATTASRCSA
jgi:ribonucleoside-diphosphate reductase alpha chain